MKIPSLWTKTTIGDLAEFQGGSQPPKSTFVYSPKSGYVRLLQIRDYKSDERATYIPREFSKRWCEKDDVMIGRYGPPIFQILRGLEGSFNVALIKATPEGEISKDYLYHLLQFRPLFLLIDRLSQRSSGQTGIDMDALKQFPVALPPLDEQERITSILKNAEIAAGLLDRVLAAKRAFKSALLHQLLSGEKRLPGFTEEWQEVRLDEVATNSSLRNKGSVPDERLYAVTKAEGLIPMREHVKGETTDRCRVVKHDWFAYNPMRLNIGSLARLHEEESAMVSPDYVVFRCKKDRLDPDFLDHLRHTRRWQHFVNVAGNGSVRVRIYFRDLGSFKFDLPPIEEQRRIAEVLNTCDREIALHRRQLKAIREQKRGLMQKLLTGEVRVKV
jgi:type I restriction enzyme S subunit